MTSILLDIRDFLVGALIVDESSVLYDCSVNIYELQWAELEGKEPAALNATLFYSTGGGDNILSSLLARIMKESGHDVSSGYLLVPDSCLINETITLPKIRPEDTKRIIERKFNPTGAIQLQIALVEESLHNQTWSVQYLPAELVDNYQESYKSAGIELNGITTPSHVAVYAVPGDYVMAAGLVYAMFELSLNAVEGFYFYENRVIHHERFVLEEAVTGQDNEHEEQFRKMTLFKVLDGIYSVNANFEFNNPGNTVHQLLLCGTHPQIHEICDSLVDAMGVEGLLMGFLLGDLDAVLPVAGRHALLTGYANALQQGVAVDFLHHDILPQKALRVRTGIYLYSLTALLALASVAPRESHFRKLSADLIKEKQKLSQLKSSSANALKMADNVILLKKEIEARAALYGVFRDLANNLPDGIFLNAIEIKQLGGRRIIELLAVTKQSPDIHTKKLLTHLNAYLSKSGSFHLSKDPVITVIGVDNDKAVQIKVVCDLVTR
jgi:hypothetical protein